MSVRLQNMTGLNNSETVPSAPAEANVSTCSAWSLKGQLCKSSLWIFIVVAVVVLVVLAYIARDGISKNCDGQQSWWDQLAKYSWGESTTLWGLLLIVGVVLFAWAAWNAFQACEKGSTQAYAVVGGFALSMLSLVAMFSVFFGAEKSGNKEEAFKRASWVAIFAAVLGFALLGYGMWKLPNGAPNHSARLAMVPYLIWITAAAIQVWYMADKAKEE